jgi:hypothetical protein
MKILLNLFFIILSTNAFCWIKIDKYNGGLFGYRNVTESHSGDNHMLGCADPGKNKCRFSSISSSGETPSLFQIEQIDIQIQDKLRNENFRGDFIFENSYFVKYIFDYNINKLSYEIYSIQEAKNFGFL